MIISCEKCNKKFEISDNLIPDSGRLLQCGSCSYKWHYKPTKSIKLVNEVKTNKVPNKKKIIKKEDDFSNNNVNTNQNKSIGFLSYIIVAIFSLIAFIIVLDTFKTNIASIIPNIDFYLSSLYESLKDIFLFFKDLIK